MNASTFDYSLVTFKSNSKLTSKGKSSAIQESAEMYYQDIRSRSDETYDSDLRFRSTLRPGFPRICSKVSVEGRRNNPDMLKMFMVRSTRKCNHIIGVIPEMSRNAFNTAEVVPSAYLKSYPVPTSGNVPGEVWSMKMSCTSLTGYS